MTLAERYLAGLYERAVDAGLDVGAIRSHLAAHGVLRSPVQVVDDLTHTYGFYGYATSHPAPPPPDIAAVDRAIDQMTSK